MKKSTTRTTIVLAFLILLVVGYFAYLSNRDRYQNKEGSLTAVEKVLVRDLSLGYPPTPKEVMKYYNEIIRCLYNDNCTEEQIEQLGAKAWELYDEELIANNDWDTYLIKLKAEIAEFKDKKRKITSMSLSASTDVKLYTLDGYEFARILSGYNVLEGSSSMPVNEAFLLRRDEEKHWKIYGWDLAQNLQDNQE